MIFYYLAVVAAIISVILGYTLKNKGEMDLVSFVFAEAAGLVIRDLFPTRDLKNLEEVREFVVSQSAVSLCMEYKVKCKNKNGSSYNTSQIPLLNHTKDGVLRKSGVHFRVYYPYQDARMVGKGLGTLLWLHGGGFVLGSIEADDHRAALLANGTGLAILSVEYRLAPEHPYPAGLTDASEALKWLVVSEDARQQFNLRSDRVFIGGESAGANLALSATLKYLKEYGNEEPDYPVRGMLLVYPPLDMNFLRESYVTKANTNGVLTAKQMQWFWQLYTGQTNDTLDYCWTMILSFAQAWPLSSCLLTTRFPCVSPFSQT